MAGFKPNTLVLHDYGGTPANQEGVFNPYHALVFPDGSIKYRNPENPYGQPAPHAFRMNPQSIGLSYAGQVGSRPTAAAMDALRSETKKVAQQFPGIRPMGHGEAYQATRGTNQQASRDGRDLVEASWRSNLIYGPPAPGQTQVAAGPVPVSDRGLTAFAGLTPKAKPNTRMSLGGPMPAPKQQPPGGAPDFFGDLTSRMQNPLFLGGLGMLVAANQGQDAASALNAGMRTGAGMQDQQMQMAERNREAMKQKALEDFWNSYDGSQLPPAVAGIMPGLAPSQRAEVAMKYATGQVGADKYGKQGSIFQDPNSGEFYSVQFSGTGERKIEPLKGLTPAKGITEVDTADGTAILDSATGQTKRTISKNLAEAESQRAQGKVAGENIANAPKAQAALQSANAKTGIVMNAIADAKKLTSGWSVGAGSMLSSVPGTQARDLRARVDTILANLGFEELQDMRNSSPSGGALGAIAVQELQMLQATKTSLDQAQTVGQFKEALARLENILAGAQERRQAAFEGTYGGGQMPKFNAGPARPSDKAAYDALPSGTLYVAPDGTTRTKP